MKPTRQTNYGKLCPKHPELEGLRYTPNRLCIECAKDDSRKRHAKRTMTVGQEITTLRSRLEAALAQLSWQPMSTCPQHKDVMFWREEAGVFAGIFTDADHFMTDAERDRGELSEEEQFGIDAWSYEWEGMYRCDGDLVPTLWMAFPKSPEN